MIPLRRAMFAVVLALLTAGTWLAAPRAEAQEGPPPGPYFGIDDMNLDGALTTADFGLFMQYWQDAHSNPPVFHAIADLNGDGVINYKDADLFIQEWLKPGTYIFVTSAGVRSAQAKAAQVKPAAAPTTKTSTAPAPTQAPASAADTSGGGSSDTTTTTAPAPPAPAPSSK